MYVTTHHLWLISIKLLDVVSDEYAATAGERIRLCNPQVLFRVLRFQAVVVSIEVGVFLRQTVGVRYNVVVVFSVLFLHAHHIYTESVLSS